MPRKAAANKTGGRKRAAPEAAVQKTYAQQLIDQYPNNKAKRVAVYLNDKGGKTYRATRHELLDLGLNNHDVKSVVKMGYVKRCIGGGYFLTEEGLGVIGKRTSFGSSYRW
jgi:hypothetical protein